MSDWIWLLIALGVGLSLLAAAVLLDARRRRRTQGPRALPGGEEDAPTYLTQEDVDALPSPAGPEAAWPRNGRRFGFGFAHPDFRTDGRAAQWADATVLVVDGEITGIRQLMMPLSAATPAAPLVVVASGVSAEALQTLAANRRALHAPVLACVADEGQRRELARWCGAEPLTADDLRAGYLPVSHLGRARRWISEAGASWVEPSFAHDRPEP